MISGGPLARAAALIQRLFGSGYTLRGVSCLLHQIGWNPQVPAGRATERDEDAITGWRAATDDLKATVISALRRLQKLPGLVRGFFADPCLR